MNLGFPELILIVVIALVPLTAVAVFLYSTFRITKSLERASRALEKIAAATQSKA